MSHLARAHNYKTKCRLFTYKDQIFKQTSRINEIITRHNNKNSLIKKNRRFLRIASWNIRTLNFSGEEDYGSRLSPNDKRPLLIKEAKRFDLDILCLQETRLLGQGNIEMDGYVLIWSGQDKHYSGVAILIKKHLLRDDCEIKYVSDRIIYISTFIYGQRSSIISAYAPTNAYEIDQKLEFYDNLQKITSAIPSKQSLYIGADFNARVGRTKRGDDEWTKVLGNFGRGQLNDNGQLLLEFCTQNELRICNSFFKHRYYGSWKHPRSKTWHQIDHILCRCSMSHLNSDCYVEPLAECWTDHQMVILQQKAITSPKKQKFRQKTEVAVSCNYNKKLYASRLIRNLDLREEVGKAIDEKLCSLLTETTYQDASLSSQYDQLSNAIFESCKKLLKTPKRKNAFWFDDTDEQIDELLNKRRTQYQSFLKNRNDTNRQAHKKTQKTIREHLRLMENDFWEKKCSEMEQLSAKGNTHAFFESLKTIYGPTQSKKLVPHFKNKDGTLTQSISESLERLQEYYCELLNRTICISPQVESYLQTYIHPTCWELDAIPDYSEYLKAVKSAKNRKSGTDCISAELLKYTSSEKLNPAVYQILLKIWETSEVPDSFLQLILCSIPKKGDSSVCENHRGISLIAHVSKVLTLLINTRVTNYVEHQKILPESQSGFRKSRSTSDMILTVKLLQQHCREKRLALYLAFLDIAKAYDSVDRNTLWNILCTIGIPPKILSLIKLLYGDTRYKVRFKGKFSNSFLVKQGLKQGCPAACLFFNIFFAIIIHVIHSKLEHKGIDLRFRIDGDVFNLKRLKAESKIRKYTLLEMLFADDAAVCAHSEEELQEIMQIFYQTFQEFGLQLALKKTEVMVQKSYPEEIRPEPKITLGGTVLNNVKQFKYLGTQISDDGSTTKEIKNRIKQSAAAFSKLYQRIWKKRHIKLKTKVKTYRTIVIPCMIYGSETWNCGKNDFRKLDGLQYRQLRTITGKTFRDKVSHVQLLQSIKFGPNQNFLWAIPEDETKNPNLTSIETMVRLSRLRYFGHVLRMDDSRLPNIVVHGEINKGLRSVGRPKINYRSCIKEDLKKFDLWNDCQQFSLHEIISNRKKWRNSIIKGSLFHQSNWENHRIKLSENRKLKTDNSQALLLHI